MDDEQKEHLANLRLEYQEINHWARHNELAWWAVGAVLLPITAGAFYIMVKNLELCIALGVGFPLFLTWLLYIFFTKFILFQEFQYLVRLKEIEDVLNMKFHKCARTRRANIDITKEIKEYVPTFPLTWIFTHIPSNIRFHVFMSWLFIIFFVSWAVIIMIKWPLLRYILKN